MPKKKGGKKGAKIIDGLATNEMSREQLQGHVKRMQIELEREREERNFFMLEREKLFSLWNMTLEQIAVEKDRARLMEVQVADGEKEKEEEMNVYKQKLRYLMMEQSRKLSTARLHHLEKMKRVQEETRVIQRAMQESVVGKERELAKAKSSIHEIIRRLKMEHEEQISRVGNDFGRDIRRLESEFNRKLFVRQTNARCDAVLGSLDIEKKEETEELLLLHQSQLEEMKKFYNDLMTNNFAIIATLQNDVEEMKSNESRLQMELKNLNDELSKWKKGWKKSSSLDESNEGTCSATAQGSALEGAGGGEGGRKLERSSRERGKSTEPSPPSQYTKRAVRNMEKALERKERFSTMLESINEVLLQRTLLAEKERNDLKATFVKAIIDMQKKASMAKLISDLKLNALAKRGRQTTTTDGEHQPTNPPTNSTEQVYSTRRYLNEYVVPTQGRGRAETRSQRNIIRPLFLPPENYVGLNNLDAPHPPPVTAPPAPTTTANDINGSRAQPSSAIIPPRQESQGRSNQERLKVSNLQAPDPGTSSDSSRTDA